MFELITSSQNPRVKNLVRLREGSHRRRQKRFLIEGFRECQRALACHWPIETLFFCESCFKQDDSLRLVEELEDAGVEIVQLGEPAFAKAAYREGPDGLLATGIQKDLDLDGLDLSNRPFIVVLEGIEKPGNIGAVFRTASAAGADALVLTEAVTDPYNPNVIRASQGAFFGLPFCTTTNVDLTVFLEDHGIPAVPTSPEGTQLFWETDFSGPVALLFGSEKDGLSRDWLEPHTAIRLPMHGVSDSLNVASSAAVALFEVVRQRNLQDSC